MIQQPSGYLVMTQVFTTKYYDLKWHKITLTIPIWKIWHWYEMWQIRMTFFYYWQIDKATWSRKCASACYLLHNMKDKKESFVILNQNQYLKADHITCMTLPVESRMFGSLYNRGFIQNTVNCPINLILQFHVTVYVDNSVWFIYLIHSAFTDLLNNASI